MSDTAGSPNSGRVQGGRLFDRTTKPALADRRRFAASGNNALFLYAWVAFRPLALAPEGRAHHFDSCRPRGHYRVPGLLERVERPVLQPPGIAAERESLERIHRQRAAANARSDPPASVGDENLAIIR